MTIVLTGGSGFIGTTLSKRLLAQGHTVVVIALTPPSFTHQNLFFIQSDVATQPLPYNVLEHTDAIINLIGAPINVKWTDQNKKAIHDSRIKSTASIVAAIAAAKSRPTVFISASASGFYGNTGEVITDEQSPNGTGFLAGVVMDWEAEARKATEFGVRVVCIRTSPVIGHGGLMAVIKKSASWGILPRLKKEDFWFSWISEMDIVNAYLFALETNTLQGVVNASAPEPVLYSTFLQSLKTIWNHRIVITIPKWLGKKLFKDGYIEMTNDSRVVPKRLVDKGFDFIYPTIESAIAAYEEK